MREIIAALSKVQGSYLGGLLSAMYKQIQNRDNANETYSNIIIVLEDLIAKGYSFESQEIQALVAMLKELPAPGACARNFEKMYLKDEYGLRKLPRDPRRIPRGHWH